MRRRTCRQGVCRSKRNSKHTNTAQQGVTTWRVYWAEAVLGLLPDMDWVHVEVSG